MKSFVIAVVAISLFLPCAFVFADEAQVNRYVEMLRQDVRDQKEEIIRETMQFKEGEGKIAADFWNVYRDYQKDLAKITDRRLALIRQYADAYDSMTQAKAKAFGKKALSVEKEYLKLRETYFDRFMKALGPSGAVRFFQVESALNHLINLTISSELPLFPQRAAAK